MTRALELKNELFRQCQMIVNYKFDSLELDTLKQMLADTVRAIEKENAKQKPIKRGWS